MFSPRSVQRLQVRRKKLQSSFLVFGIAGVQPIPKFRLPGGQRDAFLSQDLVGGDVENIADPEDGFGSHVDRSSFNVCVGAVRQSGGFRDLSLRHSHTLTDGQQLVSNGTQVKNQHLSSPICNNTGIIISFLLDKQEAYCYNYKS